MFFFDPLYLVIMALTGGLSMWTSMRVKRRFATWSKVRAQGGHTGRSVAEEILRRSHLSEVRVEEVSGFLSDHYDPRTKVLRLSPDVYRGQSVAALGVAAHEVGHALQHAEGYWPLQVRSYLAPAAAFGSNLAMTVFIMGLVLGFMGLAKVGVLLFSLMVAFTLITLPVEFDASRRAKRLLPEMGFTHPDENRGISQVLNAAALTYVAAAVSAIMTLLYLLLRSGILGRNHD